jgi:hypothetical protein
MGLGQGGEITHSLTIKHMWRTQDESGGSRNTPFIIDEQTGNLDKLAFSTDC